MKRLLYVIPALVLVLGACKGGSGDNDNGPANVDSFMSADWAFADLRGQVKVCTTVTEADSAKAGAETEMSVTTTVEKFTPTGFVIAVTNSEIFEGENLGTSVYNFTFAPNGDLTESSTSDEGAFVVRRGPGGHVKYFAVLDTSGERDYAKNYEWSGNRLLSETIVNNERADDDGGKVHNGITYRYDAKGNRKGSEEVFGGTDAGTMVTTTTYSVDETDDHGNWTRRSVTKSSVTYSDEERQNPLEQSVSHLVQKRAIVYYEE